MKYCQVNQQGGLNFQTLFHGYNANANFAAAQGGPAGICAGNYLGQGTNLFTNQSTMLSLNGGVASVTGLITCTALIAKCGAHSNYFVAHLNGGYVDAATVNKLQQLKDTDPQASAQAVYVVPNEAQLSSYMDDINAISSLGYEVCFITRHNADQKISSVSINSQGDMFIS